MANRRDEKRITAAEITGLKYFDRLAPLLERLHEVGCQRDKAGNRELYFDQYCLLILLFLFNPIVTSLRRLQQWFADLGPVDGPRLGPFAQRSHALDAEQAWLAPVN